MGQRRDAHHLQQKPRAYEVQGTVAPSSPTLRDCLLSSRRYEGLCNLERSLQPYEGQRVVVPSSPTLRDCPLSSRRYDGLCDLERSLQAIQAWQPQKSTGSSTTRTCHAASRQKAVDIDKCVEVLSAIFEVSETFEYSREAARMISAGPATACIADLESMKAKKKLAKLCKNLKARLVGLLHRVLIAEVHPWGSDLVI